MKIKQLELVFENCETIKLDFIPYKNWFTATDIYENIHAVNGNEISRIKVAKSIQIIILNEQLLNKCSWNTTALINKLEHRDITSIVLIYEDNSEEQIYVLWDEDQQNSDEINEYQHNEYHKSITVININDKY